MKKLLLPLVLVCTFAASYGQVSTAPYDSLKNYLEKINIRQYIGQELRVVEMKEEHKKLGYPGFYTEYLQDRPYKVNNHFNSDYKSLTGRSFLVLDVVRNPKGEQFLKLQDKKNKETLYYKYGALFRFVVVGHIEKMKQMYMGKEFVIRGRNWFSLSKPMINIKTGKPVERFEAGDVWKCVDISFENYYESTLILENEKQEQIPLYTAKADNELYVFLKNKADAFQEEFGEAYWKMALDGVVKVGMSEPLCMIAWGQPEKVNKLKGKSQYVYEDDYLIFTKGKLSSIEDRKN